MFCGWFCSARFVVLPRFTACNKEFLNDSGVRVKNPPRTYSFDSDFDLDYSLSQQAKDSSLFETTKPVGLLGVNSGAFNSQGRLFDRLGECWMGMNGACNILGAAAILHMCDG